MKEIKEVMTKELAFNEVKKFLEKYQPREIKRGKLTDEKIEEDFIDVIEAVQLGILVFNEHSVPTYTLRVPVLKGEDTITKTNFRSRIKQADKLKLINGLNIEKQSGTYLLRMMSYISGIEREGVNKLETEDYDTINQLCSVF